MGYLFSSFWSVESSQTLQIIPIAFGYSLEHDSKTLLLKYHMLAHRTWKNQANTDLETISY